MDNRIIKKEVLYLYEIHSYNLTIKKENESGI